MVQLSDLILNSTMTSATSSFQGQLARQPGTFMSEAKETFFSVMMCDMRGVSTYMANYSDRRQQEACSARLAPITSSCQLIPGQSNVYASASQT